MASERRAAALAGLLLSAHLSLPPGAVAGPRIFGEDRLTHLFASFFVASVAASAARSAGAEPETAAWVGAGAALGAGLAKEWIDARRPREGGVVGGDPLDVAWGALGAGSAALLLREVR